MYDYWQNSLRLTFTKNFQREIANSKDPQKFSVAVILAHTQKSKVV